MDQTSPQNTMMTENSERLTVPIPETYNPKYNSAPANTNPPRVYWRSLYAVNMFVWTFLVIICIANSLKDATIATSILGAIHYAIGCLVFFSLRIHGGNKGHFDPDSPSLKDREDYILFNTAIWVVAHIINLGLWGCMIVILWAFNEMLLLHTIVVPIFLIDVWLVERYHEIIQRMPLQPNKNLEE